MDLTDAKPSRSSPNVGQSRSSWSRFGFILAASGSAIGLGNVVFFPANAYRFGGGGFYLPYFAALLLVGLPLMTLELGLGHQLRRAYPAALASVAGRRGEWLGWWALANTATIVLYYVAILSWVAGMLLGALGPLWTAESSTPNFSAPAQANPGGFFFHMLSTAQPLSFVFALWAVNGWIIRNGATSIERAVKLFVPAMWVLMLVLLIRGVTLPGGVHGVWNLFTPDLSALTNASVWRGAFSQIFFTLSIGFGVMTAYGSYLPRRSDQPNNALLVSCLNCSFEYIAGIAIFAILFAFSVVPQASTISMTFFIVPQGIAQLPGGGQVVTAAGFLFFLLLLLAGLSSSVSMVEAIVSALIDKFQVRRRTVVWSVCAAGAMASSAFVLPQVVDPAIDNNGTLGLTLLDLVDHWAFNYGLLIVGMAQCWLLGRLRSIETIRRSINSTSRWRLGRWFNVLVGTIVPAILALILVWSVFQEVGAGLYGASYADSYRSEFGWLRVAPAIVLGLWALVPPLVAYGLARHEPTRSV